MLTLCDIFSLIFIIAISGFVSVPAQAKSKNYWISGYGGGMDLKRRELKVSYKGNTVRISGYGRKASHLTGRGKTKKLKARTYKVSSKCKVGAGGYRTSYKSFLKEEGRKGRLEGFIDIRIKNNKIVYIDYSF